VQNPSGDMCEFVACFTMFWTRVLPLIGKVFCDNSSLAVVVFEKNFSDFYIIQATQR
jgi:hypothetical protein